MSCMYLGNNQQILSEIKKRQQQKTQKKKTKKFMVEFVRFSCSLFVCGNRFNRLNRFFRVESIGSNIK